MTPAPRLERTPPRQPPLAGFENISSFYEAMTGSWVVQVLPGEFYVTRSNEIVTTVLGSCVSTCIRDPRAGISGMNHFMLPDEGKLVGSHGNISAGGRYGVHAMELLINQILKLGGKRERLEAKVFGGGNVMQGIMLSNVGQHNTELHRRLPQDRAHPDHGQGRAGAVAAQGLLPARERQGDGQAALAHQPGSAGGTGPRSGAEGRAGSQRRRLRRPVLTSPTKDAENARIMANKTRVVVVDDSGIDTPSRQELIASSHSVEEIASYVTADSLGYLSLQGLGTATGDPESRTFCNACFSGSYLTPLAAEPEAGARAGCG